MHLPAQIMKQEPEGGGAYTTVLQEVIFKYVWARISRLPFPAPKCDSQNVREGGAVYEKFLSLWWAVADLHAKQWGMADELTELILKILEQRGSVDTYELSKEIRNDHQLLVGAVKSLQSLGDVSIILWCILLSILDILSIYYIIVFVQWYKLLGNGAHGPI